MWLNGTVESLLKESTSSMTTYNSRTKSGTTVQSKIGDSIQSSLKDYVQMEKH